MRQRFADVLHLKSFFTFYESSLMATRNGLKPIVNLFYDMNLAID